jgi:transcriptional regulator with XRE-family HTH domain
MVANWELALRIRERRDELGIDIKTITERLGFSRNYWSAVENERKLLSVESLGNLFDLFEFDEQERRELIDLRNLAKERGWWTRYSRLFDGQLQRLFGLEAGAESIRGYENLLIPGLLQTADYARALMTPDVTVRKVEVDQRVQVRLRRQERLRGDNPLSLSIVISEAALLQQIGGPAVLRDQLEHLARNMEENADTISLRIIPFTATSCGLFGASTVHLINFENPMLPTLIWQETVTTWGIIDDANQVRDITSAYDEALKRALSAQDTLKKIRRRIKELG